MSSNLIGFSILLALCHTKLNIATLANRVFSRIIAQLYSKIFAYSDLSKTLLIFNGSHFITATKLYTFHSHIKFTKLCLVWRTSLRLFTMPDVLKYSPN